MQEHHIPAVLLCSLTQNLIVVGVQQVWFLGQDTQCLPFCFFLSSLRLAVSCAPSAPPPPLQLTRSFLSPPLSWFSFFLKLLFCLPSFFESLILCVEPPRIIRFSSHVLLSRSEECRPAWLFLLLGEGHRIPIDRGLTGGWFGDGRRVKYVITSMHTCFCCSV